MVLSVSVVYPWGGRGCLGAEAHAMAQKHKRALYCTAPTLGKEQNSKCVMQFLLKAFHFHTAIK